MEGLDDSDVVSPPPPQRGSAEHLFLRATRHGYCICCPGFAETAERHARDRPDHYFAPPRVLGALLTQVSIRM
jgi:hypothetical protein